MLIAAVGFMACLLIWFGAMRGIAWSWNRHTRLALADGQQIDRDDQQIGIERIARRHGTGWTVALFVFFLALGLADFPLWQRLGIALTLAVIYGLTWVSRGRSGQLDDERASTRLFSRSGDAIWYRTLAVVEWAGYLGSLAFAAAIVTGFLGG